MIRRLDQVQQAFSRSLVKGKAGITTLVSHDVCCWARFQPTTVHE